jgi:hypothetical protein
LQRLLSLDHRFFFVFNLHFPQKNLPTRFQKTVHELISCSTQHTFPRSIGGFSNANRLL